MLNPTCPLPTLSPLRSAGQDDDLHSLVAALLYTGPTAVDPFGFPGREPDSFARSRASSPASGGHSAAAASALAAPEREGWRRRANVAPEIAESRSPSTQPPISDVWNPPAASDDDAMPAIPLPPAAPPHVGMPTGAGEAAPRPRGRPPDGHLGDDVTALSPAAQKKFQRRIQNRLSARRSRERRAALMQHLQLDLTQAERERDEVREEYRVLRGWLHHFGRRTDLPAAARADVASAFREATAVVRGW